MFSYFAVKERPELESQFVERVQKEIKYASMIDDFDKLVDPWTLARHCLGLEPSPFVLCAICREEKSKSLWDENGSSFFHVFFFFFSSFNLPIVFSFCKDDDKI